MHVVESSEFACLDAVPTSILAIWKLMLHIFWLDHDVWELPQQSCDPSIALHINPRFDEHPHLVIQNTYVDSMWGDEEREGGIPLRPGQRFIMSVTFQMHGFEIAVNGWHFTTCKYLYQSRMKP